MNTVGVLGLPGTGKTTTLIEMIKESLHDGVPLDEMVVTTFRQDMALEIGRRAVEALYLDHLPQFHNFRTTHSICYRLLGLEKGRVVTEDHRAEFCRKFGVRYEKERGGGLNDMDLGTTAVRGLEKGNRLFRIMQYLKHTKRELDDWAKTPITTHIDCVDFFDRYVRRFEEEYQAYKKASGLFDYEDMLIECIENGLSPNPELLVEDEFQDKTPLLIDVHDMWAKDASHVIIAGDPHQAIYDFMGTSPLYFMEKYDSAGKRILLDVSHRFGPEAWEVATNILKRDGYVVPNIRVNGQTTVYFESWKEHLKNLRRLVGQDVLFLTRTRYIGVEYVADALTQMGIPISSRIGGGWSRKMVTLYNAIIKFNQMFREPQFSQNILRIPHNILSRDEQLVLLSATPTRLIRGTKKDIKAKLVERKKSISPIDWALPEMVTTLRCGRSLPTDWIIPSYFGKPERAEREKKRMKALYEATGGEVMEEMTGVLNTIHGSKGQEADYVYVYTGMADEIARNVWTAKELSRAEARVYFVATTRARKELHIVHVPYTLNYTIPNPRSKEVCY